MGNNQSNHFPHIPEKVTWSLNTIINGKSQTLLSYCFEGRGGCTQATQAMGLALRAVSIFSSRVAALVSCVSRLRHSTLARACTPLTKSDEKETAHSLLVNQS